jgi:hypothetical protein
VGKCAAPADEADHKYVLRGWTDAGRGCDAAASRSASRPAGKALNLPAPPVAGPALLSLNFYKICRRRLRESGRSSKRPRPDSHECRGIEDATLEPVIGLAEGETRWRGMTAEVSGATISETSIPDPQSARPSAFRDQALFGVMPAQYFR